MSKQPILETAADRIIKLKNNFIYSGCLIIVLFTNCTTAVNQAPVLLFNGTGTSPNDVEAVKNILSSNHLAVALVNSAALNTLDSIQLKKYKLLIIPGGNFIDMGKSLTNETAVNIQSAVQQGLNYLGICAGGFLAGDTHHNSFNIAEGRSFKFYSAENKGTRKAAVATSNADGTVIEQYWEDGPQFNGWGHTISKYPDGSAATVEGNYGSGWIILTGIHAEAPESWRKDLHFSTTMKESHQYMLQLILAAMEKKELAHF